MPLTKTGQAVKVSGQERRSELIQIVFNEIAEKGLEGFRFQEVAAAAGITNATLYYYFPSKEVMTQSLVEWLMSDLNERVNGKQEFPNAMGELRAMFEDLYARVVKDARFFVVITELALRARRDPVIAKIGRQRDRSWEQRLRGLLQRGIDDGSFRKDMDVETTCLALMVQVKGIAHHAAMEKRKPSEMKAIMDEVSSQIANRLAAI